ncbi:hypothetical protein B8A44_05760 [Dolosigranulum pigrum]|jgi:hypothetical protein|uniref:Uncharacterized protein n=1 Tax=Dolosigranulum pigrum TaxID=29394 RepID=A0A328KNU3_9LACT|nr:hypothetical protein [Dolosigranulum pigrum]QJS96468.1 hypothetical protein B5772_05935 [Dolosigranulum pigrum]QTJ44387.1 hypothetical protein FE328_01810 [Dolosigranulum pigrum]RAN63364.1 hypothetical protein B8A44_05760 [Dolosigranulum pigrum]
MRNLFDLNIKSATIKSIGENFSRQNLTVPTTGCNTVMTGYGSGVGGNTGGTRHPNPGCTLRTMICPAPFKNNNGNQ